MKASGIIDGNMYYNIDDSYGIWCDWTIIFFQNYWWLRSPSTAWGDYVWLVYPDGDVDYYNEGALYSNVDDSYGRLTR